MAMWEKKGKTFVACYENVGILKNWSIVDLQFCVSGVQQSDSVIYIYIYIYTHTHTYTYIHIYFSRYFSLIGYNKILSILAKPIQYCKV